MKTTKLKLNIQSNNNCAVIDHKHDVELLDIENGIVHLKLDHFDTGEQFLMLDMGETIHLFNGITVTARPAKGWDKKRVVLRFKHPVNVPVLSLADNVRASDGVAA